MKISIIFIFFILLSEAFSIEEEEELVPLSQMTILPDESYFYYQFSSPPIEEGKDAYFYFKIFAGYSVQMIIIDGDKNETNITIPEEYGLDWIGYKLPNLKTQLFNVIIYCEYYGDLYFIDSTKELDMTLTDFIFFDFKTTLLGNDPPIPLIFNIDTIQNDTFYYFVGKSNDSIYDRNSLIEYCVINEKECAYERIDKGLNFEKGTKYKLKLNYYFDAYNDSFYFESFFVISPMDYGLQIYQSDDYETYFYYIINIKGIKHFNIFLSKRHKTDGYLTLISEEEKNNLSSNFNSLVFTKCDFYNVTELNNTYNKDYIIIKILQAYGDRENILFTFDNYKLGTNDALLEIPKGQTGGILIKHSSNEGINHLILSTNNNMQILEYKTIQSNNYTNKIIITDYSHDYFIYVKATSEESKIKVYQYETESFSPEISEYQLVTNKDLKYYLDIFGPDSLFMRTNTISSQFKYNITYLFDIQEKYYLYIKKYSGSMEIYKNNKELNVISNYMEYKRIPRTIINDDNYKSVTNQLLIIEGYYFFIYFMEYNNLFDLYLQKVNDNNYININPKMFPCNNLVKLLNEKEYYINFELDHLIKLDNNFLDAVVTFTDTDGKEYHLNNETRVIKDLKGTGIKLTTNKKALIYFYKRIENYSNSSVVIFDKNQKRKNMQFNITNTEEGEIKIYIAKDFGFEGYYPMLSNKSYLYVETYYNNNPETATIYIDNIYDTSNYEPYESDGEKYIIYIFDSFENGIPTFNADKYIIDNITYTDNLLTPNNIYNFEFIEPNKTGSVVLNAQNKYGITYQFIKCKPYSSRDEKMKITIYSSNKDIDYGRHPMEINLKYDSSNIQDDLRLNYENQILYHTFETNTKYLFIYSFSNSEHQRDSEKREYSISLNLRQKKELQVSFYRAYDYYYYKDFYYIYYIIAGIQNDIFNKSYFSNECNLAELMLHNSTSESIIIKKIIVSNSISNIKESINITKFNMKSGTQLVVNVICYSIFTEKIFKLYNPQLFEYEEAIEIDFNQQVSFDFENLTYFSFEYNGEEGQQIYLIFKTEDRFSFRFFGHDIDETKEIRYEDSQFTFTLIKTGTYFIRIIPYSTQSNNQRYFTIISPSVPIDIIDLSQKYYNKSLSFIIYDANEPLQIKVKDIKKDTQIIFDYFNENRYYSDYEFDSPFIICEENNNNCKDRALSYKFLSGKNYTIYINISKRYNEYLYLSYYFFSVFDEDIEKNKIGFFSILEPKIFIYDLKNLGDLNVFLVNGNKMLISYSDKSITLDDLDSLNFFKNDSLIKLDKLNGNDYSIIIPIKNINKNNIGFDINNQKIILAKKVIRETELKTHTLHAGENEIIYIDNTKDNEIYGVVRTFSSSKKNMRYIHYNEDETTDIIIQGYMKVPIYINEPDKDIIITINEYWPKYSLFTAFDKAFYKYMLLIFLYNMNRGNSYLNYFPLNTEINTDIINFHDYINLLLYDLKTNITIYIKKYYGNSNLYECDTENIDINNLSYLTRPINTCRNKTSVIDKIYHFDGTKLITGNLGMNNYYDIFLEFEGDTNIKLTQSSQQTYENSVRYLKKDIEYNISFNANHLVHLDPSFNAEVIIYNDQGIYFTLNSSKPIQELIGNDFKIKSNKDVVIYFHGKKNMHLFRQRKIFPPKGKNIEIIVKNRVNFYINFGFEGYAPKDNIVPPNTFSVNQTIYMENMYDKLKTKLVEGEYLYLYMYSYGSAQIDNYFEISYESTNLNNPNNAFSFLVIKNNTNDTEKKSLIINNNAIDRIKYQIIYCKTSNSPIIMYYRDSFIYNETQIEYFDNQTTMIERDIAKYPFKLTFDSNEDFIFSYSFIDNTDKIFNNNQEFINERKELDKLNIVDIIKPNPLRNIFNIKFYPNYKYSSTRYIIIIAIKDENNNINTFSNRCYLTQLITEKNENITIKEFVDIGDNEYVIADIEYEFKSNVSYVINIISQELRFSKKINYYIPYEFKYNKENIIDINIGKEQIFELGNNNNYFNLNYNKASNKKEMLLLYYKIKLINPINIKISTSIYEENFIVNNEEGYTIND